jgi:uncharacterized protein YlxW (UPF0749 family)
LQYARGRRKLEILCTLITAIDSIFPQLWEIFFFLFHLLSSLCILFLGFLQARERQRREEREMKEREAAEAERKRKEEEEALERAAREAAEKEAALARRRQEKAMSLGSEPEKGPDVTQVMFRCHFHHYEIFYHYKKALGKSCLLWPCMTMILFKHT